MTSRRNFLKAMSATAAIPLLTRCTRDVASPSAEPVVTDFEPPQKLQSFLTKNADGTWVRTFEGVGAPQNLSLLDETGSKKRLFDLFPRSNCPFGINDALKLGKGGLNLSVPDRTSMGQLPGDDLWALQMVPFGLAIDGVLIDPSGPWYDGGPADPQNPFDRSCSGWEYDPIFGAVAELVGVPAAVRGHVQPGPGGVKGSKGTFHYHGQPRLMLSNLRASLTAAEKKRALLLGWSGDGFPIVDSLLPAEATSTGRRTHLFSGYVLRDGARAAVPHVDPKQIPSGTYDGTYKEDWVFDPEKKRAAIETALKKTGSYEGMESGEAYLLLDARNGLFTDAFQLPDTTARAYAYVITPDWPEVPRWFAFEPSASFRAIIPFASDGMGPPGRKQMYDACPADRVDIHPWVGRAPY